MKLLFRKVESRENGKDWLRVQRVEGKESVKHVVMQKVA